MRSACLAAVLAGCLFLAGTARAEDISVVLAPRREAVLSAETDAKVQRIHKEFGQFFKKGALLVQLDPEAAGLGLRRAEAVFEENRKIFKVLEEMRESKSCSVLELAEAESELAVSEVDLAIAKREYDRCAVRAPFSGRVHKVLVHEHEWVKKGQPLMEIWDHSTLLAKFLLPSSSHGSVKVGDKVRVAISETGREYPGTISHVGSFMDPSSRSYEVYAAIANPKGTLRSGMRGVVKLPGG